mgnify:CR=1 FL=1|jgi:hypothetical protein
MTKNQINTRNQNIEEMFVAEMDNLYYPGYAEEIANNDPEKYKWELAEFKGVVKSIVPVE